MIRNKLNLYETNKQIATFLMTWLTKFKSRFWAKLSKTAQIHVLMIYLLIHRGNGNRVFEVNKLRYQTPQKMRLIRSWTVYKKNVNRKCLPDPDFNNLVFSRWLIFIRITLLVILETVEGRKLRTRFLFQTIVTLFRNDWFMVSVSCVVLLCFGGPCGDPLRTTLSVLIRLYAAPAD